MKYFTAVLSLLCTIIISNSYASDRHADLMKNFYLYPAFPKLEYITSSIVDKNKHIEPWQLKILHVFSTMAIYNNKGYPKEIINNFSQYSPAEKELLMNALYASGNANSAAIIKSKYR